jgi:hypothetical protein
MVRLTLADILGPEDKYGAQDSGVSPRWFWSWGFPAVVQGRVSRLIRRLMLDFRPKSW